MTPNKSKEIWEMTPTQYRIWRVEQVRKEYGCTVAEAEECVFINVYYTLVEQAAFDGKRIPNIVLDRFSPFQRYSVLKRAMAGGHDKQFAGYVYPEFRKAWKAGIT